ncbi:MAG: cation-transporting P-type ATPase, partial [Eubacteriales bacterium]
MELNIPPTNRQVPASPHPLTEAEVQSSRSAHGDNRLSRRPGRGFWRQFLANLGDPVIRILLCALGLNLLFAFRGADWFETGGIALAVFLATLISTLSEYGSEAAFARLSEACAQTVCRVRRAAGSGRDGLLEIPTEEVVVGDLVSLGAGEMIPADGVLLSGEVVVDQSAMTGETKEVVKKPVRLDHLAGETKEVVKKPVRLDRLAGESKEAVKKSVSTADKSEKAAQKPTETSHPSGSRPTADPAPSPADPGTLFRGCVILGGQGEMLVTRVGDKTFLGEISDEVQMDTRESPLKYRLNKLAGQISRMGYVAAALVALIFLLNAFLFDSGFDKSVIVAKLGDWRYVWNTLFHALTLGLTVLVVAVPEGLPMMIAVVLSSNIKKMVKDQVLVRKPVGIEAAGSMNLLFTDKTGTLTEGSLSVGQVILGSGQMLPDMDSLHTKAPLLFSRLADACMTNTQSKPGRKEEPPVGKDSGKNRAQESRPRALGGNATDRALMDAVLRNSSLQSPSPVVFTVPFDSSRKTSAALVRRGDGQVLYVKGAPERLLPHVSGAYREDGQTIPLDKSAFTRKLDDLTRQGGRVLLLCERVLPRGGQRGTLPPSRENLMRGQYGELTLVCAVLLADRI